MIILKDHLWFYSIYLVDVSKVQFPAEYEIRKNKKQISKIAFMDCMLDYLRDRFNSGSEFDSETIKLRFFEPKRADNEVYMVIQNTKQSTLKSW